MIIHQGYEARTNISMREWFGLFLFGVPPSGGFTLTQAGRLKGGTPKLSHPLTRVVLTR